MMSTIHEAMRVAGAAIVAFNPYLNGALGLVVFVYIMNRLLCCSSQYNRSERLGMGLIAGGILIATPALWVANTPFDGWSFNVARAGMALYIITGGMRRDRHARRNAEAVAQAEAHFEAKAKS